MPVIPSTPVSGRLYHGPRQFPVGRRTLSRWPWQETGRKAMAADRRTVLIAALAAPAMAAGRTASRHSGVAHRAACAGWRDPLRQQGARRRRG